MNKEQFAWHSNWNSFPYIMHRPGKASTMQMSKAQSKWNGQMEESKINGVRYFSNILQIIQILHTFEFHWAHISNENGKWLLVLVLFLFHWQLAYDAESHFICDLLLKISNGMKLCRKEIGKVTEIHWKLKRPKLHCESGRTGFNVFRTTKKIYPIVVSIECNFLRSLHFNF